MSKRAIRKFLVDTAWNLLVEANPCRSIWGCGRSTYSSNVPQTRLAAVRDAEL